MNNKNKLKSSVKYPTSLIVGGDDFLAVEITKSLIEQGGYVIIIDNDSNQTRRRYADIKNQKLLTILDYSSVEFLDEDLRRLDYVFYLAHSYDHPEIKLSSQEFLRYSNYLDLIINLTNKYEAKMLLTSSIKANQIILNSRDEIDFGKSTTEKHVVYSQTEMQRYAEALVFESIDKLNLDARVTRLGRVIGPGMDFELEHSFDKLVMDAVLGKDLKLKSDGLESNMYVHVLDAAYGTIKAMFTKDTKGNIYSISNDEEITDLSIAYKLQELVGLEQEIKFEGGNDDYPAIKYHKPAKSLTSTGWLPRVSFHRALVQSFDYAKEILVQEANKAMIREEKGEGNEADDSVLEEDAGEPKGALARLIAERKAQELSRRGSILIANEKLKDKSKAKRELSSGDKISRLFQRQYDSITHRLRFLKKITLSELVLYTLILFVFAIIYIGFIAPVFVMLKNLVFIEYYSIALDRHVENESYGLIASDVENISENVTEFSENYDKFEGVYSVFGYEEEYQGTESSLNALSLHIQAISEAYNLNQAFYEYFESADYSLVYRPSSESLLDLGANNVDQNSLAELLANSAKADQLDTKIEITSQSVRQKPVGNVLGYDLANLYDRVYELEEAAIDFSKFGRNFSEYFLSDGTKTYAIVLQDDNRYTPAGGYPAAIGVIQIRAGELLDIELVSLDSQDLGGSIEVEEDELVMIQAASAEFKSQENTVLSDLFLIPDKDTIEDDINDYVFTRFGLESQAVIYMNTDFQKQFLALGGELEINQVVLREDTFLSSLELLLGDDNTIGKRNEVLANVLALQISDIAEDPDLVYQLVNDGDNILSSKALQVQSNGTQIAYDVGDEQTVNENVPSLELFPVIDPNALSSLSYPVVTLSIRDNVFSPTEIERNIDIELSNAQDLESILVCMPSDAANIEGEQELAQTFLEDRICVTIDSTEIQEFALKYTFEPAVETGGNNEYNMKSVLDYAPGLLINYDVEISSDSYEFAPSEELINSSGKLIDSGELAGDKIINFSIRK
ncbi:NAD-dependent epimerase/dehydratase family protein [Candidatus Dojkabacteria bacterium]|nr:NAD-dependent epimerase/dehydratase family protein [Candidatus Dojkabacteria bacterium]